MVRRSETILPFGKMSVWNTRKNEWRTGTLRKTKWPPTRDGNARKKTFIFRAFPKGLFSIIFNWEKFQFHSLNNIFKKL